MLRSWLRSLLCAVVLLFIGARWEAASAATLNVGTVSASTDGQAPDTETFSSVPYVTPAESTADDASSTVTPDATGLVFKGTFSQTVLSATGSAAGTLQIDFSANAGDTYSLFGSETPTVGTGALGVSLFDNTTSSSIYSYSNSGTLLVTADSSGGPRAESFGQYRR